MKKTIVLISALLMFSRLAGAQQFAALPAEVMKSMFPGATFASETKILPPDARKELSKKARSKLNDQWTFTIVRSAGKIVGYALIDNVLGKTEPITFLLAINPDGSVKEVELLAYREAYGGEVREDRFLDQYKKKNSTDLLQIGKDIKHITGATISSRSVTVGVKRDLLVWNYFYHGNK